MHLQQQVKEGVTGRTTVPRCLYLVLEGWTARQPFEGASTVPRCLYLVLEGWTARLVLEGWTARQPFEGASTVPRCLYLVLEGWTARQGAARQPCQDGSCRQWAARGPGQPENRLRIQPQS